MPAVRIENEPQDLSYKGRVERADPNNGRFSIQNLPTNFDIEYCHVIPRKYWRDFFKGTLDSLEWHWNMRNGTLNLDTRQNIFPVGPAFRHMFDTGRYVLTPSKDIVNIYRGSLVMFTADRDNFPRIEDMFPSNEGRHTFEYNLVPLRDMESLVFLRLDADSNDPPTNDDIHIHRYPFNTLPTLVSPVHPEFMIVSAGRQMYRLGPEKLETILQTNPILLCIYQILLAWTRNFDIDAAEKVDSCWPTYEPGPDDDAHSDEHGNEGDDPNDPDYEDRTEKGRLGS